MVAKWALNKKIILVLIVNFILFGKILNLKDDPIPQAAFMEKMITVKFDNLLIFE